MFYMSGVYVYVFMLSQQFGRDQKLEFSVELKGGSVDWASKDKSSKKHVLEVKSWLETGSPNSLCLIWLKEIWMLNCY